MDRATPTEARATAGAWWMLVVLLLFYIISILDRIIVTMLVEPIKADLNLNDFEMSLLLGPAFALCYAVCGFPIGWAVDKYPRRWVVYIAVSFWSVATAACGLAGSFVTMFLSRMAVGVGEAGLTPAAYSLIADSFPRNRLTTAMAIFQTGNKVGQGSALALGGALIGLASILPVQGIPILGEMKQWQLVFVIVGVPGLFLALLALTFREPPRRDRQQAFAKGEKAASLVDFVSQNKLLVGTLLLGFGLVSIISSAVGLWIPAYMTRAFGWTPVQYGPALGIVSIVAAGVLVLTGAFVDRLYAKGMKDAHIRFYTWQLTAFVPIGAATFFIPSAPVFIVLYGVIQCVALPYMIYMSSTVQLLVVNELRGRTTALFMFVIMLASLGLGPVIVAALTDFVFKDPLKLGWSLAVVTVVCTVGALAVLRFSLLLLRPALEKRELAIATPVVAQIDQPA